MNRIVLILVAILLAFAPVYAHAEKVWTSFTNHDTIYAIAAQGPYLWCATSNGPVRWDTRDMSYRVFNGIADNRVSSVAADKSGNIWFGTITGVHRWDGQTWKRYSLGHNHVTALAVAPDGSVWAAATTEQALYGYYGGRALARFNEGKLESIFYESTITDKFYSLAVDKKGMAWTIYKGKVSSFDGTNWKEFTAQDGLPNETMTSIHVDAEDIPWAVSKRKIACFKDGSWKVHEFNQMEITSVISHPVKGLILGYESTSGMTSRGIGVFADDIWTPHELGTRSATITSAAMNEAGTLYGAFSGGICRFKNEAWTQHPLSIRLPVSDTRFITADPQGDLWIAGLDSLIQFDGISIKRRFPMRPFVNMNHINDIQFDHLGNPWFATTDGVYKFDWKNWIHIPISDSLPINDIRNIAFKKDGAVLALADNRLFKLDDAIWHPYKVNDTYNDEYPNIYAFAISPDDSVWVGKKYGSAFTLACMTNGRIVSWNETGWFGPPSITTMGFDAEGTLWTSVSGNKGTDHSPDIYFYIYKLSGDKKTLSFSINAPLISMLIASNSSIWVGSRQYSVYNGGVRGGGLFHLSQSSSSYTTENGLIDNEVRNIAITHDGAVWAGTPSGITRYGEPLESYPTRVADNAPVPVSLLGNSPNPFNASTVISFALNAPGETTLSIYSITGQKIRTLISGPIPAGTHTAKWDGRDNSGRMVSSGIYISRLRAGNTTATARMLLLK